MSVQILAAHFLSKSRYQNQGPDAVYSKYLRLDQDDYTISIDDLQAKGNPFTNPITTVVDVAKVQ